MLASSPYYNSVLLIKSALATLTSVWLCVSLTFCLALGTHLSWGHSSLTTHPPSPPQLRGRIWPPSCTPHAPPSFLPFFSSPFFSCHQTLQTCCEIHPHPQLHYCSFSPLKSHLTSLCITQFTTEFWPCMAVVLCAILAFPTNNEYFSDKTLILCFVHILAAPRTLLGKERVQQALWFNWTSIPPRWTVCIQFGSLHLGTVGFGRKKGQEIVFLWCIIQFASRFLIFSTTCFEVAKRCEITAFDRGDSVTQTGLRSDLNIKVPSILQPFPSYRGQKTETLPEATSRRVMLSSEDGLQKRARKE